jgi:autotransporter strand-loop-strand O-heptosyltransferase
LQATKINLATWYEVAEIPTQEGPNGIRFDFNDGCRVMLPPADHAWRVRLSDIDTGNILYETEIKAGSVNSSKRYFVRFRLEVWQRGQKLVSHDYSAADRGQRGEAAGAVVQD